MSSTSPTLPSILDRDPASLTSDECLDAAVELAKSGFYLQFRNFVEFTTLNFDNMTFAQKKDSLEMLNRVSGLAKRQEVKDDGGKFVFNIVYRGGEVKEISGPVTLEAAADTPDPLAKMRASAADISFDDAPEFS